MKNNFILSHMGKDTSRNGQCSSAAKSVFTPKTCILCKIIVTYLNLS